MNSFDTVSFQTRQVIVKRLVPAVVEDACWVPSSGDIGWDLRTHKGNYESYITLSRTLTNDPACILPSYGDIGWDSPIHKGNYITHGRTLTNDVTTLWVPLTQYPSKRFVPRPAAWETPSLPSPSSTRVHPTLFHCRYHTFKSLDTRLPND